MVTHALTRTIIFKFNKGYSGCHCRLAVVGLRTAVGLPQSVYHAPYSIPIAQCLR